MPKLHAEKTVAERILRAVRRVELEPRRKERKRRRVLPGGLATTFKTLYLPSDILTNYVLPQKLDSTAYGFEWTPSLTDYFNFGDEQLTIIDYFNSIALPGQWLTCEYSTALEAWTPIPGGQNAIQKARTYKTIEANTITTGDDVWIMAHEANEAELFEISDMNNDAVSFEWATSGEDIIADQNEPAEIWLYLMSGGWQVIGRACNP